MQESWRQIDVALKCRHDWIPNLVETVKGYATHERDVDAVTRARARGIARLRRCSGPQEGRSVSWSRSAVAEADLKASTNFLELQRELTETEDRIAAGRRFYNANVRALNTRVESFPSNLVAASSGSTGRSTSRSRTRPILPSADGRLQTERVSPSGR